MNIPPELSSVLISDPETQGGRVCFIGTRVPVETFLDYINNGDSLDSFLSGYRGVSREQALKVLAWQDKMAKQAMGLAS